MSSRGQRMSFQLRKTVLRKCYSWPETSQMNRCFPVRRKNKIPVETERWCISRPHRRHVAGMPWPQDAFSQFPKETSKWQFIDFSVPPEENLPLYSQPFFYQFIFIVYAITVVSAFPPFLHLHPAPSSPLPKSIPISFFCPWVVHKCSLVDPSTIFHPFPTPCPSFQQLSVCFMYISFCLYFIHSFIVFIRFHI